MTAPVHVAAPPAKPLLVFDGDCNFCRFWIARWQRSTGDRVDYLPFQDPSIAPRFPELPRTSFETAVQFIEPDGRVSSGAEAVFRSLATRSAWTGLLFAYQKLPGIAPAADLAYRCVARNRMLFSWITRLLWGRNYEPPTYHLARSWFLRGLGVIYLIAFASLWLQLSGLIGSNGILPAADLMTRARGYFDAQGIALERYHALPTLSWFSATDGFLHFLCAGGTMASLLLIARIAPALAAAVLWTFYLSLVIVGRDFLAFQWDTLLLETGLLAIFLAPLELVPKRGRTPPMPAFVIGLFWWLLFRLMLESGWVKLLSGDATWWGFTALNFHYETQPLPPWTAWYAHQLPATLQKACVGALFLIELVLPFFIFAPRRLRMLAGGGFALLQVFILGTGNYGFFNYLTLLLCLLLLEDRTLRRWIPARWQGTAAASPRAGRRWPKWAGATIAIVVLMLTLPEVLAMFRWQPAWLRPARAVAEWAAPLRSFNRYGLFAVMTTSRPEIIVEGSNDRQNWLAYEFKFKPGQLDRRPAFVAPHQPRLDWQMWFAALGTVRNNPWFISFCARLLQGTPAVLALLEKNPFPEAPPTYVRAMVYSYHFTPPYPDGQPGAWWRREPLGTYLPPVSLKDLERAAPQAR